MQLRPKEIQHETPYPFCQRFYSIHTILLYEEGYLTIVVEASLCAITDEEHTNLF